MNYDTLTRPDGYLIAADFQHACLTASVDCGWKQTSQSTFRDGNLVIKVIDRPEQLRGLPRGTKLYIGYGFLQRKDAGMIVELARVAGFVVIDVFAQKAS